MNDEIRPTSRSVRGWIHIDSWQMICQALVISLPVMLILCVTLWPETFRDIPAQTWGGLIYVALFSMLIGFFFWYLPA